MKLKLQIKPENKGLFYGIIAILSASILFGSGYSISSLIEQSGMPKSANVFWICVISAAINYTYNAVRGKNIIKPLSGKQLLLCVIGGVAIKWAQGFMFMIAYGRISVEEATMLHFLHPSLIALAMTLFFKEQFRWNKTAAIVCSLCGAFFITGGISFGSAGNQGAAVGMLAAVSTGFLYGLYPVFMDVSPLKNLPTRTVIFYLDVFGAITAFIMSFITDGFTVPIGPAVLGYEALSALTAFFAYVCYALAVRNMGATKAAFGSMLEPVASCIFAAIIFGSAIESNMLIGGFLVMMSLVFCTIKLKDKAPKHA